MSHILHQARPKQPLVLGGLAWGEVTAATVLRAEPLTFFILCLLFIPHALGFDMASELGVRAGGHSCSQR